MSRKIIGEEILDNIREEIKEFIDKNLAEKLIYWGGIGSQQQKENLKNSKIIDLDLVYIFGELDSGTLDLLDEFFKKLAQKYTSKNLDVIPIIIHGPIKVDSSKDFLIIIHNLVFDKLSFDNLVPLMKFSIQNTALKYYGSDKILKEGKVVLSKNLVLNSPLGINDCIKMIKNKITFQFAWDKDKKTFVPSPLALKDEIYFETICYSVIRSTINLINLISGKKYSSLEDIESSDQEKITNIKFLNKIINLKNDFRNKKMSIKDIDLEKFSSKALIYLTNLAEIIK